MATAVKTLRRIIDDGTARFPINLAAETAKTITSITRSGTTATLTTSAAHTFSNGNHVFIDGVFPEEYNGVFPISNASGSVFDYTLIRDPGASASVGTAVCWRGELGTELDLSTALGVTIAGVIRNGATGPTIELRLLIGLATATGLVNMKWREFMVGNTINLGGVPIHFGLGQPVMFANVFAYGNTGQAVDLMVEAHEFTSIG